MKELIRKINTFVAKRNWHQFHNPKNLSMALSVEASELVEIFQWLTEEESKNLKNQDLESVKDEIADIFIYLLRISDVLDIDVEESILNKIEKNKINYPLSLSKDNAIKYNKR